MFTNYGTQFLWPFSWRITFNSVFVIDPLYTLPFLVFLLIALFHGRENPRRRWWNWTGIIWSCSYLLWGVIVKLTVLNEAPNYFPTNKNRPTIKLVTPMPLTSFYWMILAEDRTHYYVAYKSIFSSFQPEHTDSIRKTTVAPDKLQWQGHNYSQQLAFISDGNFVINKTQKGYIFSDLRFGVSSAMTSGKFNKPIMGFELIEKRKKIIQVSRHRPQELMDHITFENYLQRVFGKK
jgi:inner membrane protein